MTEEELRVGGDEGAGGTALAVSGEGGGSRDGCGDEEEGEVVQKRGRRRSRTSYLFIL